MKKLTVLLTLLLGLNVVAYAALPLDPSTGKQVATDPTGRPVGTVCDRFPLSLGCKK